MVWGEGVVWIKRAWRQAHDAHLLCVKLQENSHYSCIMRNLNTEDVKWTQLALTPMTNQWFIFSALKNTLVQIDSWWKDRNKKKAFRSEVTKTAGKPLREKKSSKRDPTQERYFPTVFCDVCLLPLTVSLDSSCSLSTVSICIFMT